MRHSLVRTSPKGQNFVGTCRLCGKPGLTFASMDEECENVRGLTADDALIEAINPDSTKNDEPSEKAGSQNFGDEG